MEPKDIIENAEADMQKAVEHTLHEFSTLHTGKASPSMVDGVQVYVESYGTTMRLRDCAAISAPDPRMITIQPWDKGIVKAIEKAIREANLGFNPGVDGGMVRCPVPELSKERRTEMGKIASRMAEDGRIAIRNHRREAMEMLKALKKDGDISEDDEKRYEKEVQKVTDKYTEQVSEALSKKEQELMQV